MSNTINIGPGTVIGAMAVGSGAQASGSIGGTVPTPGPIRFTFEAKGATREQVAKWLRSVALVLEDPEHPSTTFAKTEDGASRAWTITREAK